MAPRGSHQSSQARAGPPERHGGRLKEGTDLRLRLTQEWDLMSGVVGEMPVRAKSD